MSDMAHLEKEIHDVLGNLVQYDLDKMFPRRTGFGARRKVRAKLRLIANLLPGLSDVLLEGEKLLYVARGGATWWWEQLFGGYMAAYTNVCIVLTDCRILLVNTNRQGKPKHYRNQILYTEIARAKMRSSFVAATLKFRDGRSLVIVGLTRRDKQYVRDYIPELVASMPEGAPRTERSIQYLCPRCPAIHTEHVAECAPCGTVFKSPKKAALKSLILPGLGEIYLGYTALGIMEMIGSFIEWGILILIIYGFLTGDGTEPGALITWPIFMAATNAIAYFLALGRARKGLIAESAAPSPGQRVV